MNKHLVFVGGGHAHLTSLLRLEEFTSRGHRVTVISPAPYQYYSGMGPGMLAGIYAPREIRFHIRKMVGDRGATFVQDSVTSIDAANRRLVLRSGTDITYDVVSFNTGSGIAGDAGAAPSTSVFPVKPIINLLRGRELLLKTPRDREARIVVAGGGPAGVEVTANAWRVAHDNGIRASISLVAGSKLLKNVPESASAFVRRSFGARGIRIIEAARMVSHTADTAVLGNGEKLGFDALFIATGVTPGDLFRSSGLPTGGDGSLLVNENLECVDHPGIFGGGDCITLKGHRLARVGVYAVRENPVLFQNIGARLNGGPLAEFSPQKRYMLILYLGNDTGVLWRGRISLHGTFAFRLKDSIDRKFMRKFQVSGELSDQDS